MYVMRVYVIFYIINYEIHHVIGVIVVNFQTNGVLKTNRTYQ